MELDAWLVPFRRFGQSALEQHLDKMEKVSPVKGRKNIGSRDEYARFSFWR
jgi:hypothetical protein